MKGRNHWFAVLGGVIFGAVAGLWFASSSKEVKAASNDRYSDYIMCTGAASINPRIPVDAVWLLDYRSGKLLGTIVSRTTDGKVPGWAEVDLVSEFRIAPKTDVHFMMTTGNVALGQAALYVCEVNTGKFGVYTIVLDDNTPKILRHDMTTFRSNAAVAPVAPAPVAVPAPMPEKNNE